MLEPLAPLPTVGHAGPAMPDPEVRERPVRRTFTAEYKLRIVEEANAAPRARRRRRPAPPGGAV